MKNVRPTETVHMASINVLRLINQVRHNTGIVINRSRGNNKGKYIGACSSTLSTSGGVMSSYFLPLVGLVVHLCTSIGT